jgi:hypothetical protein
MHIVLILSCRPCGVYTAEERYRICVRILLCPHAYCCMYTVLILSYGIYTAEERYRSVQDATSSTCQELAMQVAIWVCILLCG